MKNQTPALKQTGTASLMGGAGICFAYQPSKTDSPRNLQETSLASPEKPHLILNTLRELRNEGNAGAKEVLASPRFSLTLFTVAFLFEKDNWGEWGITRI